MKLVVSAVNFTEGGPLTVLRDAVSAAADHFPNWTVYALVHKKGTVSHPSVVEIPFPQAKSSWLRRLLLEWFGFRRLSLQLKPDVWLSLHDITPRVEAGRQYVYCHNPAPFCTFPIPAERHDRSFALFRRFYGRLYRIFIHRNAAVIVQQHWLRQIFVQRYGVGRVIVAHPDVGDSKLVRTVRGTPARFFFPAFPRVFKNFELLGECAELLEGEPRWRGHIVLTIDGSENGYSREILARFGHLRSLCFTGLQPPAQMDQAYQECDALIFPSLLETWGLPLTEAKVRGLPIACADLPYARETVGHYDQATFFDPTDPPALASLLLRLHLGEQTFGPVAQAEPEAPFANGWRALLEILLVTDAPDRESTT